MAGSCLIGVAGGTASGKSTLVELLQRANPDDVGVMRLDDYYLDSGHIPRDARGQLNFDQLEAFDLPSICSDLLALQDGKAIEMPSYDFESHTRTTSKQKLEARPVILVEGIIALAASEIRECFDLGIYVYASEELRFTRRLKRDTEERGRTEESVRLQWENGVKDFHDRVVEPSKAHADLVIQSTRFVEAVRLLQSMLS